MITNAKAGQKLSNNGKDNIFQFANLVIFFNSTNFFLVLPTSFFADELVERHLLPVAAHRKREIRLLEYSFAGVFDMSTPDRSISYSGILEIRCPFLRAFIRFYLSFDCPAKLFNKMTVRSHPRNNARDPLSEFSHDTSATWHIGCRYPMNRERIHRTRRW